MSMNTLQSMVLLAASLAVLRAQGTVPTFDYPVGQTKYALMGGDPGKGSSTTIPTVLVPVALSFEAKKTAWYGNAEEIATFLADANPAWPADTLNAMMREHLDGTLAEASARLSGDWAGDIAAYDRIHTHILAMADALAAGIVEQFPARFER